MNKRIPACAAILLALAAGSAAACASSGAAGEGPPSPAAAADSVYEVAAVDGPPRVRNEGEVRRNLVQIYPPALRDAGITGSATVRLIVHSDGRVSDAAPVWATRNEFRMPAVRAVRSMRFIPATLHGHAVPVRFIVPVTFDLSFGGPGAPP